MSNHAPRDWFAAALPAIRMVWDFLCVCFSVAVLVVGTVWKLFCGCVLDEIPPADQLILLLVLGFALVLWVLPALTGDPDPFHLSGY